MRAANVIKLMFLLVSKYPPNAILCKDPRPCLHDYIRKYGRRMHGYGSKQRLTPRCKYHAPGIMIVPLYNNVTRLCGMSLFCTKTVLVRAITLEEIL